MLSKLASTAMMFGLRPLTAVTPYQRGESDSSGYGEHNEYNRTQVESLHPNTGGTT